MTKFSFTIFKELSFSILVLHVFGALGASIDVLESDNVDQPEINYDNLQTLSLITTISNSNTTFYSGSTVPSSIGPKIEKVTECVVMGEGPHWDVTTQSLYHVDVFGKYIVRYIPSTKEYAKKSVAPKIPSFIIPIEGKPDHFLVSLDNELDVIKWNGTSTFVVGNTIRRLDVSVSGIRISDAKCDSNGRLWAGTIDTTKESFDDFPAVGNLYTVSGNEEKCDIQHLRIANGLAFNYDIPKMYYIDSSKGTVDQYDFDAKTGEISNGNVLFTLNKHKIAPGLPDGMTIDTDGNLWVAIFNGYKVIQIDGRRPETLLQVIEMPTKQVTSMTFGGSNLDELYVTTGALEAKGGRLPPPNGATYRITGTGSRGLPGFSFKWN